MKSITVCLKQPLQLIFHASGITCTTWQMIQNNSNVEIIGNEWAREHYCMDTFNFLLRLFDFREAKVLAQEVLFQLCLKAPR